MSTQPVLRSNGLPVPFDKEHFAPMRDSTEAAGNGGELRARFQTDGYLLLRGVLDPDEVRAIRRSYFSQFDRAYFKPGTDPAEGIFSGTRPAGLPPHGTPGHPAHAFVRTEEFRAFASQSAVRDLAETLLGGQSDELPRLILRHFDRHAPLASRAHTDYRYLDAGSDQLVTVWIPIGDCPLATGGLIYLEDSDRLPAAAFESVRSVTDRPDDDRPISHDLALVAETVGKRWLWTDYHAGDVAVHSPYLVHASLDTATPLMRLSCDVRYVRRGEPVDPRWTKTWSADDGN